MRVLVVDDEPLIGISMCLDLQDAGHEALGPAVSTHEALAMAADEHPDLALVDIHLEQEEDGVALARTLRREHGVPCMFVSGSSAVARANKDAAMGFLPKPVIRNELVATVEVAAVLLAGGVPPPPPVPRALELY